MPEFKRLTIAFDVESGGPGSGPRPEGGSESPLRSVDSEIPGHEILYQKMSPSTRMPDDYKDIPDRPNTPFKNKNLHGKTPRREEGPDTTDGYRGPAAEERRRSWGSIENALASTAAFPPDEHQMRICIDTLKNPMKGQFMGGPSAEEAEKILREKFQFGEGQIQKLKGGRGEPPNAFNRPAPKLR